MQQAIIALPDLKVGDWAGYVGWDGNGYSWECWHEGYDERTGALRTFMHEDSPNSFGDVLDALADLTAHMCDEHGMVTA